MEYKQSQRNDQNIAPTAPPTLATVSRHGGPDHIHWRSYQGLWGTPTKWPHCFFALVEGKQLFIV